MKKIEIVLYYCKKI